MVRCWIYAIGCKFRTNNAVFVEILEIIMIKDPYFYDKRCVDRLMTIYKQHKNLVIAVDFDDTVYDTHENGFIFPRMIGVLKKCNELELDIVMFTASTKDRFPFIKNYMETELGIEIKGINENIIPDFPYGNDGKIFYNILLDDRAGLGQSINILKTALLDIEEIYNNEDHNAEFLQELLDASRPYLKRKKMTPRAECDKLNKIWNKCYKYLTKGQK